MKLLALLVLALAFSQTPSLRDIGADRTLAEAECSSARIGDSIPVAAIGERVSGVTLAQPIKFRVLLPARWTRRAVQLGGGGMNGTIPNLAGGVAA